MTFREYLDSSNEIDSAIVNNRMFGELFDHLAAVQKTVNSRSNFARKIVFEIGKSYGKDFDGIHRRISEIVRGLEKIQREVQDGETKQDMLDVMRSLA